MIVKNEAANLRRCLPAVADHIDCWVIGDTGSTDGTQEFIKSFFTERSLPGELHSFAFHNFEQARNAALDCAAASPLPYDYLLFADADMELVVDDPSFQERLEAPGYRLIQQMDSGLVYWNTRLVRRNIGARYHGVTHEYIDVPGGVKELQGVWYKDHASGSNRIDKFKRDIKLLREGLKKEPENHRYWFYLAQSYRDAGQTAKAAKAYAKRSEMGGWDEEAWSARLQEARCLRKLGDDAGFLRQALAAFNQRPQRAEPLYDLARFYREKGMNDASVLFSEAGLAMKRPEHDILFLEDFVYRVGLQEEYSIAANYARDPARKSRGFAACNWLSLQREIPDNSRELAYSNLFFYLQPASAIMASFAARRIEFTAPDGYRPLNPSVTRLGEQIVVAQRTVNYTLTEDGLEYKTPDGGPIHTRNFLLSLTEDLDVRSAAEILPPDEMPEASYRLVLGFEDLRIFDWRGELWGSACVRELTPEGWCEQVLARIDGQGPGPYRLTDWRVLHPEGARLHQKNWMPQVVNERPQFIYLCDPTRVVDENGRTMTETTPKIAAKRFSGGSQAIAFDGGWVALIHEVQWKDQRRVYQHRFVWFDQAYELRKVSRPFFFQQKGIEFAAGLACHPDETRLLISYSVADSEAWIATVDAGEVRGVLEDAERLPSGVQESVGCLQRGLSPLLDVSALPLDAKASQQTVAGAANAKHDGVNMDAAEQLPHVEVENMTETAKAMDLEPHIGPVGTGQDRLTEEDAERAPSSVFSSANPAAPVAHTAYEEATLEAGPILQHNGEALSAFLEQSHADSVGDRRATNATEDTFVKLAPFLRAFNSPEQRRCESRAHDMRIAEFLKSGDALPQIHCFYEVLSDNVQHDSLIAATTSMRAVGHPVRVWSYSPEKLDFLLPHGIEVRAAHDVVPRGLFERIVSKSEIRYFSDIFRYAALYEYGGLWMDTDMVLLRPFRFQGDHFLNLQWGSGVNHEHFVCGNVMYAKPFSRHMRNLYELAIHRVFGLAEWSFGDVGPKLLSDYVSSSVGAELRDRLFSPMFFNSIDWTEADRFNQPIGELVEYLNDERLFGIHLWNAKTNVLSRDKGESLISLLCDPLNSFPSLTNLADRFNTDKNRHTGNRHCYARIYDRLLSDRRFSLRQLMEIGLCRWNQAETPSVTLWQTYFPFGHIFGIDFADFSAFNNERFTSFVCDQSKREDLCAVAAKLERGSFDVIIDDGSHASCDQQLTLREFFPLLADGGWYFIEDLDWQPPGEDGVKITLTKNLLQEIQQHGAALSADPLGVSELFGQIDEILFFDSHYELNRAKRLGGLAAIHKRGGTGLIM